MKTKMTINDLLKSVKDFDKKRLNPPEIEFSNIEVTAYVGTKMLLVHAMSKGSSGIYKTLIAFYDVEFVDKYENGKGLLRVDVNGKDVGYKPPSVKSNPVRVHCSCSDYYFVWSHPNYKTNVHYGKRPRPYVRKTSTRPPRNPENLPGMCKHLLNLVQTLKHNKMLE